MLHLKIKVEENKFLACVEECRTELARETKLVPQEGSEKMIKEHRVCHTHASAVSQSHGHLEDMTDALGWVWKP